MIPSDSIHASKVLFTWGTMMGDIIRSFIHLPTSRKCAINECIIKAAAARNQADANSSTIYIKGLQHAVLRQLGAWQ